MDRCTQNEVATISLDSLAEELRDLESRSASVTSFVAARTGSREDVAAITRPDDDNDGTPMGSRLAPHDAYLKAR